LVVACDRHREERAVAQSDSGGPILQVGLVVDAPVADSVQMAFPQKERGWGTHTNEVLTVRIIPGLVETNLEKKDKIWQRGDTVAAEVWFKGEARKQLADVTRTNIGKDIVVIIDGKVFWIMKLGGELDDGRLLITGNWTLKEAQAFCKRIDTASRR
jgi:hypothetical protein